MSAVPPPPSAPAPAPPPAAPAPASAPPQISAAAPEPPEALARAAPGTRLEAVVTSGPRGGAVEAQTSAGKITLETPLPLPKDSVLSLLVAAREPVFRLTILSVDGTPAQVFARLAAQAPAHGAAQGAAAGASAQAALVTLSGSGAALAPGLSLTATLLTPGRFIPAPAQAGAGASAPASAPGAGHIGGHVRALALFGQNGAGRGQAPGQAAGAGAAPGRVFSAAAGSAVRVTVLSLTAPAPGAQPAPQPPAAGGAALRPGMVLHGTVTGQTRAGHAVVQTQAGAVALPSAAPPPPPGAKISFTLDTAPEPPPGGSDALSPGAARALLRAPTWPSFTDAMQTLERADPGLAQQVAAGVLPNPAARGGALAASILTFLGALKTGDVRAALGDAAMRAIERARPAAAARLDGDFRGLARAADDPNTGGDWRVAAVPLALGQTVQPARLLMRRRSGENGGGGTPESGGEGGGSGGRFVVDVTLKKMGRVQLDGNAGEDGARLDLTVRTEHRLPAGAQNDIRNMFAGAAALTGASGGLTFQAGPGAFIEFDGGADPAPGAHVGVEA